MYDTVPNFGSSFKLLVELLSYGLHEPFLFHLI